jgi:hypothetical protein
MTTATLTREILDAHPQPTEVDRDLLARCIQECVARAQTCTACSDADVAEDDVANLRRCIRLCLDCADICEATGRMLTRQTDYDARLSKAQLTVCRQECASCAEECERHADHHEHCRICAEECRRCEEACSALLDAIE